MSTTILGISAFFHDSAAALVRDGEIIAAAQEERFTRRKQDEGWPRQAIAYCLREAGIGPGGIDAVVFYEKPLLKLDRILETFLHEAPFGLRSFMQAVPLWAGQRMHVRKHLHRDLQPAALGLPEAAGAFRGRVLFTEHHRAHAASAFYPSPFEEAAILTVDGTGEWATTTIGHGKGREVKLLRELHFPHSIGLLYSAFTYFCGFRVNSGEYKLMGLAPYGQPKYADVIRRELIELADDGALKLQMDKFDFTRGQAMTGPAFEQLFGGPPRVPETPLTTREADLAASVQAVTEEVMLRLAREAVRLTGCRKLCLAGGVALNCVANGKLLRSGEIDEIWIQPAAGDAGGALGGALDVWHNFYGEGRRVQPRDAMHGSLLGPAFGADEVKAALAPFGAKFSEVEPETLPRRVAELIASEKVVGFFQGRMEFGPRALGSRSIIGDARSPRMQSVMNVKIKFRESFRPFAPCVLAERAHEWFDLDRESPYMLLVADVCAARRVVRPEDAALSGIDRLKSVRSQVPAITHVDYSARVQTVDAERHGPLYRVMKEFEALTGCPVVINTSFNIRGEPIVCRPEEAYRCFMQTDMDALVLGNIICLKEEQPPLPGAEEYRRQFKLD